MLCLPYARFFRRWRRKRRMRWKRRRRRIIIITRPESQKNCRQWHKQSENPYETKNNKKFHTGWEQRWGTDRQINTWILQLNQFCEKLSGYSGACDLVIWGQWRNLSLAPQGNLDNIAASVNMGNQDSWHGQYSYLWHRPLQLDEKKFQIET